MEGVLKKELQKLVVRAIVDDEDFNTQTIDQAKDTLSALKELKLKKRSMSLKLNDILSCPQEFRCPLSKELMRDPVIGSTGEWFKALRQTQFIICAINEDVQSSSSSGN